ncbi:MAG: hypothetical protein R3E08_13545 [Thiotrichaceae bacterium]
MPIIKHCPKNVLTLWLTSREQQCPSRWVYSVKVVKLNLLMTIPPKKDRSKNRRVQITIGQGKDCSGKNSAKGAAGRLTPRTTGVIPEPVIKAPAKKKATTKKAAPAKKKAAPKKPAAKKKK